MYLIIIDKHERSSPSIFDTQNTFQLEIVFNDTKDLLAIYILQDGLRKTQPMIQKVYYKQRKRNKTPYIL